MLHIFRNVCSNVYMDTLPEVLIDGHADTKVAFIPNIIDYVLREILKNSFRYVNILVTWRDVTCFNHVMCGSHSHVTLFALVT